MLVVDAEMSGTDVRYHGIVSVGGVDLSDPARQFYGECRVFSDEHVMEDALAVNGFTRDGITDPTKPDEGVLITQFLAWAGESTDHTLAGHNPYFDLSFLKAAAFRSDVNWTLAERTVDLHSVCIAHLIWQGEGVPLQKQRSAINSDWVFEYVGLPREPHPHNALNGAKWEAEAFSRLLYKKRLLEEFAGYPLK